ncbi:Hypothetical predicted protein [Mytilus galloprovincialis]|uniref:Novel STAND NTPase 3 domain-containing protein n=1 Tax=Mytilus galloprovincialis TaxID=29158 RepID=A0A8B6CF71_MYTGA|nr:Hypothetical predicted protein [Mytilus galloprovincialis]
MLTELKVKIILEYSKVHDNLRELQTSHSTLQTKHTKVTETVNLLQTELAKANEILKDPIPPNIKDQIDKGIKEWENNDKMFVTTRASEYVFDCLKNNSCLTLTAPSGVGKSFIARHTALVLQKEGYTIIPVLKPDDIRDYYQPDELYLTAEEKDAMASIYIDSNVNDLERLSQNSEFFPLLCSLFDVEKHGDVKEFFKNPFIFYQNELDSLKMCGVEGKNKLCSLALIVLLNNQLTDKWFKGKVTDEQRDILEDTCEACRLNRSTSKAELKEALNTLDGTFVYKQNGIYKTLHDKLFDFLANYFGQKMIECIIDHGNSDLVHEQ